jgi:hypothetical protein
VRTGLLMRPGGQRSLCWEVPLKPHCALCGSAAEGRARAAEAARDAAVAERDAAECARRDAEAALAEAQRSKQVCAAVWLNPK